MRIEPIYNLHSERNLEKIDEYYFENINNYFDLMDPLFQKSVLTILVNYRAFINFKKIKL